MKRSFLCILAAAAAAILMLSGCLTKKTEEPVPEETPVATATAVPTAEPTAEPKPQESTPIDPLLEANDILKILETHDNVHYQETWDTGTGYAYTNDQTFFKVDDAVVAVSEMTFPSDSSFVRTVTRYGTGRFSVKLILDRDGTRSAYVTSSSEFDETPKAFLINGAEEAAAGMTNLEVVSSKEENGNRRLTVIGKDPDNGEEMFEGSYLVDPETDIVIRGESSEFMGLEVLGTRSVQVTLDDPDKTIPEDPLLLAGDTGTHTVSVYILHTDATDERQTYRVASGTLLFYEDYLNYTVFDDETMRRKHPADHVHDSGITSCIGPVEKDISIYVKQLGDD